MFCLVGDGELDEGSNWEAVQLAGRLALARLTAIVVDNASATYGWPGGVERRFEIEGWDVARVDGRDHDALERCARRPGRAPALRRRGGDRMTTMRSALLRRHRGGARRRSATSPSCSPTSARREFAAPSARLQRGHPRAGDDRRRGRSRARGIPPGRALVRAVPRRAAVRAAEARPRPPGRRRRARQRRCVVRRRPLRAHAPGARGCRRVVATLPGWTIHVPGHPDEVERLLSPLAGGARPRLPAAQRGDEPRADRRRRPRRPSPGLRARSGRRRRRADARGRRSRRRSTSM